jgi:hypothetical protein
MSTKCSLCDCGLGRFDNYGTDQRPLCFDCSNNVTCAKCGKRISVDRQISSDKGILCRSCVNAESIRPVDPLLDDDDLAASDESFDPINGDPFETHLEYFQRIGRYPESVPGTKERFLLKFESFLIFPI